MSGTPIDAACARHREAPAGFVVVVVVMRRGFNAVTIEAGGLSDMRTRIASAAVTAFACASFVVAMVLLSLADS